MSMRSLDTLARTAALLVLACAPTACVEPGADSEETTALCEDGESRACTGKNDCRGERTCEDGSWGSCECTAHPGAPGASGAGGDAGAAGQGPVLPKLGAECETDKDCPDGAECLTADASALFGGGAPHGVCAADCSEDPKACDAFDHAVCVDTTASSGSERALCLESCSFGDPEALEAKCHGRLDVACEAVDEVAFCRPLCMSDSECGELRCDRGEGVCRSPELVAPDIHFGTDCAPDAEQVECSGLCLALDSSYAVCSHRCTFGDAADCAAGSSDLPAACVLVSPGGTLGDVGFCGELCDCNDDCASTAAICDPFEDEVLENTFGYLGTCTSPFDDDGEPKEGLACP